MKSAYVTFTLLKEKCPPVSIDNTEIPQSDVSNHLGLLHDRKFPCKHYILEKETNEWKHGSHPGL